MLVRWCLPHKVCRFPTLRCWVTAGVNWVTAQWTPRLQCSDWGLLLFLSSQMTWKNMKKTFKKKTMTIMEHPPFSDGFPMFPHSKNIKNHCTSANSISTSPWAQLQMSHWSSTERGHLGLPAQDPIAGPYLSYFGRKTMENPSHLARWPSGPQTCFVGKCSIDIHW